jgi:DNA-binding winged helix-turn-helix (wHTH) protein
MAGTPVFGDAAADSTIRFGPFELDVRAAELRKNGIRIRLQEQPLQILLILLERQGQIVLREEIRNRLWPGNMVVEFDHSINAAVRRLRDALQDSADKPRYVETVARRGYRFIGEVDGTVRPIPLAEPEPVERENGLRRPGKVPATRLRPAIVPGVVAAIVIAAWGGAVYRKRAGPASQPVLQPLVRLDVDLGGAVSPSADRAPSAILSTEGTRLVYVSESKLFTRQFDQADSTELPGTDRAEGPFFSPDGQWVAFNANGKLKKISVRGGPVIQLCDVPGQGGSWGEDGNIITMLNFTLSRVPAAGGTATSVTELAPGEMAHRWPQILPGGKAVIFTAYPSLT